MGKPWVSTFLSMLREVVFGAGFPLILPLWFGLNGVLYSMPLSDLLTFVVSVTIIKMTYNELNKSITA
jgi:Na+-driven multidrug efflux pump